MATLRNALFGYTDGDHVILKPEGGYTVAYLERGNILNPPDFPDRKVRAKFPIDKLYALHNLNKKPKRQQVSI